MLYFLLFTFAFCLSCVWQLFNKRMYDDDDDDDGCHGMKSLVWLAIVN